MQNKGIIHGGRKQISGCQKDGKTVRSGVTNNVYRSCIWRLQFYWWQNTEPIKNHLTVYVNWANFITYKIHLNKAVKRGIISTIIWIARQFK